MRVCTTRILSIVLAILLCCTPELVFAMSGQDAAPANQQASGTQTDSNQKDGPPASATVPEAPQAQTSSAGQTNAPPQNSAEQPSQPEGTAAARAARTIGGPASKPAGSAIAPAKQRQVRSLLIKIGAIAGAGAALGTVYALTRGTPSKPPGAR
jgi:hypothetical protein